MTDDDWFATIWARISAAELTSTPYPKTDLVTNPRGSSYAYGFPAWNAAERDELDHQHQLALDEDLRRECATQAMAIMSVTERNV